MAKTKEKSEELLAVEQEHGFVFGADGTEDNDHAQPTMALVCSNPVCDNRGQHIQIHADTVIPIFCGSCGTVLHCDHDDREIIQTTGTVGQPLKIKYQHCDRCGRDTHAEITPLDPLSITDLPISVVDALKASELDPPGNIRL